MKRIKAKKVYLTSLIQVKGIVNIQCPMKKIMGLCRMKKKVINTIIPLLLVSR